MKRPSDHELFGKLKSAAEAAVERRIRLLEPLVIEADLLELNILADALHEVLPKILSEVRPRHYKGGKPPENSYEDAIRGCEIYAFRWESRELGCTAYFKFALKNDSIWIVSLHPDRPRKEGD